jgi:hypothetical protein
MATIKDLEFQIEKFIVVDFVNLLFLIKVIDIWTHELSSMQIWEIVHNDTLSRSRIS